MPTSCSATRPRARSTSWAATTGSFEHATSAAATGDDRVNGFTQGQDRLRIKGFGPGLDALAELQAARAIVQADGDTVITLAGATTITITLADFTGTLTAADVQLLA